MLTQGDPLSQYRYLCAKKLERRLFWYDRSEQV